MLSLLAGVEGRDREQGESDNEDEEESDEALPPTCALALSTAAGVQEVMFDLAQGRVAGGIGADPGGGFSGGRQQAAGIKVDRIAGVAVPLGGNVVQA